MSETRVDGFCLLNIDVPLPTANPALALLTACLSTLSTWVDWTSQSLSNFISSAIRLVDLSGRAVAAAVRRRPRLFGAARASVTPKTSNQHESEQPWTLDATEAQVIIPETQWDARNPSSYIVVLDYTDKEFFQSRLQSRQCPVINIAASTDHEFIKALSLYENLKSRSLAGTIGKLLSVRSSVLEFVVVKQSKSGQLSFTKTGFHQLYAKSRDRWMYPDDPNKNDPPLPGAVFNHILNNPHLLSNPFWRERESWVLRTTPQRTLPLTDFDLHNELIGGPIAAMILKKKLNVFRLAVIILLYTLVIFPILLAVHMSRSSELDLQVLFTAALHVFILTVVAVSVLLRVFTLTRERQCQSQGYTSQVTLLEVFGGLAGLTLALMLLVPLYDAVLLMFNTFSQILLFRYDRHRQRYGVYRATLQCHCGKRIATERPTTIVEQRMVRNLYSFGARMRAAGAFSSNSMTDSVIPAFDDTILSFSMNQERSAVDDTSQDIVQNPARPSSSLGTLRPEPGAATQRRSEGNRLDRTEKFLYSCYPSLSDRNLDQVTVSSANKSPTDKELIEDIKKQYFSNRSNITRLKNLRGFSAIRLARFEYYRLSKSRTSAIPIQWKWPEPENKEWETSRSPTDPFSEESGLSQYMLHFWEGCNNDPPLKPPKKRQALWLTHLILKYSNTSYTLPMNTTNSSPPFGLSTWPKSFTLFLQGLTAPEMAKGKEPTKKAPRNLDWTCISLEVDFDDRLADPRAIYHRTPKKLRTGLKPDPTGINPPIAWAIWIDEDFVVPWYLPLTLLMAAIGIVVFAAWYTAETGTVNANGWTIGSCVLAAVVLAFNGWVLWAKDSKHARV